MAIFVPFLKIFSVLLLALMSPGPNFVLVSNLALARGRRSSFWCAAGMATGDLLYSTLSLLGLGILLKEVTGLALLLKVLGGLYLAYIGIAIWCSTLRAPAAEQSISNELPKTSNPFGRGFLTSITNPKVIIFYGSMFTLALSESTTTSAQILLPILCAATSLAWYGFVGFVLSEPRIRAQYMKIQIPIDRIAGSVLIVFGLALAGQEVCAFLR